MTYLLIPCGDGYAELLAKHKADLASYYIYLRMIILLLKRLINKVSFYEVCEEFGLPLSKNFYFDTRSIRGWPLYSRTAI